MLIRSLNLFVCQMGKLEQMSIFRLFLIDVLDFPFWLRYAIALLKDAFVPLAAWWTIVYFLSLWLLEPREGIFTIGSARISSFVILFHTARCTVGYCCYVFRELIDHAGLDPKSGVLKVSDLPSLHALQDCCNSSCLETKIVLYSSAVSLLGAVLSKYTSSHMMTTTTIFSITRCQRF